MDVTIGPAWEEAIASAARNALDEVSSSSERRLGLSGEFCMVEVSLSISCALLTAVETPG